MIKYKRRFIYNYSRWFVFDDYRLIKKFKKNNNHLIHTNHTALYCGDGGSKYNPLKCVRYND